MYEVVQEHAKFAKGEGTGVGKELLSLPHTPEYNYAANTYLTALAYIRELEERLTKRAADSSKAGGKSAKRKVVKSKVIRPAESG